MKSILLGTTNPSKLTRMGELWAEAGGTSISPLAIGCTIDPEEDAKTAIENAMQKAVAWHRASGLPVLTEDSGLVFLDLPRNHTDQPGVRVRRACGHHMDDDAMLAYYQALIHRHGGRLHAAWQDAWCLILDEAHILTFADDDESLARHAYVMVDTPCTARKPGWPLDSLTLQPGMDGRYKAEVTNAEMDAINAAARERFAADRAKLIEWMQKIARQLEA